MFLNDPYDADNSTDPDGAEQPRTGARKQGGNNYSATYNRVWGRLLVDAAFNKHDAEITDIAAVRTARNTVAFQRTDVRTLADEQLGGYGQDFPETRPTIQGKASMQYQWREHRFKAGFEWAEHKDIQNLLYLPSTDPAQYTSICGEVSGRGRHRGEHREQHAVVDAAVQREQRQRFQRVHHGINTLPNRASFYSAYDTNGDGTITQAELGQALVFNSTAGNPNGADRTTTGSTRPRPARWN